MKNESQEDYTLTMPERRRVNWEMVGGLLIFLVPIVCVAWYYFHEHQIQLKVKLAAEIRQQREDASIAALASKYNAVTNWSASLFSRGFSIDVSRALIQSNGQPVLIIMGLKDVAESRDGCTALFSKDYVPNETYQLSVELKCTLAQASQLLKTPDNIFPQKYAVVARCEEVMRPKFKVSFGGVSSSEDGDSSPIVLDDSSDVILVKGKLLDALKLP